MDFTELIKWVPQGGAAGAVILVVYLFLKQQDKASATLVNVADTFADALAEYQKRADERQQRYDEQLRLIAKENSEANAATQLTVNNLVRDQIVSNAQMADAIRGLQAVVTGGAPKGKESPAS